MRDLVAEMADKFLIERPILPIPTPFCLTKNMKELSLQAKVREAESPEVNARMMHSLGIRPARLSAELLGLLHPQRGFPEEA